MYNLLPWFQMNLQTLLFWNPVKGGFNCYSSGVIGFLPRKQGDYLISLALTSLRKNDTDKIVFSNLNFLLSKNSLLKLFWNKATSLVGAQ